MTSRERVSKALNFEKPDRVPIDLGAMRASGIAAVAYEKLKKRMGLESPIKLVDSMQLLAEVETEVLEHFHIDVVPLDASLGAWPLSQASEGLGKRLFSGTKVYFPPQTNIREDPDGDWLMCDENGEGFARMPKDGYYFDFRRPTMAGRIDPDKFQPAQTVREEELRSLETLAKHLYNNTDKAILGWGGSISLMGLSALLSDNITQGSLDTWLVMLMSEKQTAHEMMGRYVDAAIKCLGQYNQAVGDYCMVWGVASDDAGTQRSGLISPELFAEMIKPHYKRLCDWVHANTNWKTFLHSCGCIYDYIEQWIEAGIDVLNPVQISAAKMEPSRLMDKFGGRIVFWGGGCDTQKVLPLGTPEDIREQVGQNISIFNAKGGYVFTQVHNIQADVPVENIEAMLEAAYEFGNS